LLALIVICQLTFYVLKKASFGSDQILFGPDLKVQQYLDSVLASQQEAQKLIKPFNPNFISDYKGYVLGMSPAEIDRLHRFRETGRFLKSEEEFLEVTQVPESTYARISPFFKFPQWKRTTKATSTEKRKSKSGDTIFEPLVKSDLNSVKRVELMKIKGVGKVLSGRIVKFRTALGGFLSDEQLQDVYGLELEVIQRISKKYTVLSPPEIKPIDLGHTTADELAQLVYISRGQAYRIIRLRDSLGELKSVDEIEKILDIPTERFNRIKLYLTL
jgi:DNA uptake protein ComE-like DNA-binding protein